MSDAARLRWRHLLAPVVAAALAVGIIQSPGAAAAAPEAAPAARSVAAVPQAAPATAAAATQHTVRWDQYSMIIDGKRQPIWSGEMHPFRLPSPSLWRDMLQKMKSGGFNTVGIYVDWDYESPAPGVYDWTGVRDLGQFLDIAQEVGLYVMVRPGPYINSETAGGGFPGWLKTIAGKARTDNAEYLQFVDEYYSQVNAIIAAHQLTNGTGPVVMYQIENEFAASPASASNQNYMAHLYAKARTDGITVPIFHNDKGRNGFWIPGSFQTPGETPPDYLYGFDGYPAGTCNSAGSPGTPGAPPDWGDFGAGGATGGASASPTTPGLMAEFGGGWFSPWGAKLWGGRGYECMVERQDVEMARRYYLTNVANGIAINNVYMVFGGTSWGWLAAPVVYSSYDYGAAFSESREIRPKADAMKEIGYFVQSVPDVVASDPVRKWNPVAGVTAYNTKNAQTGAQFYYVRQDADPANITMTLPISTGDGDFTIPQQGSITFTKDDLRMIVADYALDAQHLVYSTSDLITHYPGVDGAPDVALFTTRNGLDGETVLKYPDATEQPTVTTTSGPAPTVTWDGTTKTLRLNYTGNGLSQVKISGSGVSTPLLLLLADETTAATFWRLDTNSGPVLVRGPENLRTAVDENSTITLTGDTLESAPLEVWGFPQAVGVTWNGAPVTSTETGSGSFLASANLAGLPALTLPTLTNWKYSAENPEVQPNFDDSDWTAATKTATNSTTKLAAGQSTVLYADDYGFHKGDVWYRGTVSGPLTGVTLGYQTGQVGMMETWLDGKYLGTDQIATPTSSQSTTQTWSAKPTFAVPADQQTAGQHTIAVLVRPMATEEDGGANDAFKSARGLTTASAAGATSDISWKIQGNQGGQDLQDTVRGTMNNGGLYGERAGWYLPGYPDSGWQSTTLPDAETTAGVSWYRTTFDLHVPTGVDASLGLSFDETDKTKPYRALVFINGWNMGQYINDVGPQSKFPLPNGILNPHGGNTLAIAMVTNTPSADGSKGGLPAVSLVDMGSVRGGTSLDLVASPGYQAPAITPTTGLTVAPGAALDAELATVTVPKDATGTRFTTSIDWGDGSAPDTTAVGAGGTAFDIHGTHTFGTEGSKSVTVTIADSYGGTLATGTVLVTVGTPDTTAPVSTATTDPAVPPSGWFTGDVTVSITATDETGGGGVRSISVGVDGADPLAYTAPIVLHGDGTHVVSYAATDLAGNVEATRSLTVKIDGTGPVTALTADPAQPNGSNDWYTAPVTLTVSGTDTGSGVAQSEYSLDGTTWTPAGAPIVLATDGRYVVRARSVDVAGNVGAETSLAVGIDVTAPEVAAVASGADPVTVTIVKSDETSGIASVRYRIGDGDWVTYTAPFTLPRSSATQTVTYSATDKAGNVSEIRTLVVDPQKALSSTTVTATPTKVVAGGSTTVTVAVSSAGTLTGAVVLVYDNGVLGGAGKLNSQGRVAVTLTGLAAGRHSITAEFLGTAGVSGSVSPAVVVTAGKAVSHTTLTASSSSQVYGGIPVTLKARVAVDFGGSSAGRVAFKVNGVLKGYGTVRSGVAVYALPRTLKPGLLTVTAVFVPSNTALVTGSTSPAVKVRVVKAKSRTTLSASSGTQHYGGKPVTLAATVTLDSGAGAAGRVAFRVNGAVQGYAAVHSGTARYTLVRTLKVGTKSVTAVFVPADPGLAAGSTSNAVTVRVLK